MFGALFEEEGDLGDHVQRVGSVSSGPIPPAPRLLSGLCGIYNQGATCYLNSLLQTLVMTPEFRESLFCLGTEELGKLEDQDKPGAKVRVIPLQLQRLFSKLLLQNEQGISTTELTDSFGWTNNESLQQHDAQELNRILFSAIEDSLVGTTGHNLINKLYRGTIVNQIICQECGRISARKEDFLDLTLAVEGMTSLECGLAGCYVHTELMEGNNQYRCEQCNRLVNATKGAKLRHLPDVLTISLLRFSFDFTKMERYKETGKYAFGLELDMKPYCEDPDNAGDTDFELFSVVIHRGSSHGGHYHAYIRDIDALGKWTHPDEEEIQLPTDPATGVVDFIEFDSPVELIQAIIHRAGPPGIGMDKLCAELVKQTGVSWNKRFRKQYGPINKFLKKYDDKFVFDQDSGMVSLKLYTGGTTMDTAVHRSKVVEEERDTCTATDTDQQHRSHTASKRPKSPPPAVGWCWFDFDDCRIRPIRQAELEKQFSGKESAYMLFYRKKSMIRQPEAWNNPAYGVPDWLLFEVIEANNQLDKQREEYETRVNTVTIEVHFARSYQFCRGALQPIEGHCSFLELTLDRRKNIEHLKITILDLAAELVPENFVIHTAKQRCAGLHLYDCISGNDEAIMRDVGIDKDVRLFVWDGKQVDGEAVPTGATCEPLYVTVTYGNPHKFSRGFSKSMTLAELRKHIEEQTGITSHNMLLSRIIVKGDDTSVIKLPAEQDSFTLDQLQIGDDCHLVAELDNQDRNNVKDAVVQRHTRIMSFLVENRSADKLDDRWPVMAVEIDKDSTIAELKTVIISQLGGSYPEDGGRLREDDDFDGLRPPLHEEQTLSAARLRQGAKLVLEAGPPPHTSQITVMFTVGGQSGDVGLLEVMVDRNISVQACMQLMLDKAGLKGPNWHLCRTNWFGEGAEVLDDTEATLEQCQVHNGSRFLLEEGQLPPKGYLKLPVLLLNSVNAQTTGMMSWITNSIHGLLSGGETESQTETASSGHPLVGEVVISKDATLEDLKMQIQTLPAMSQMCLPSAHFMRLRLMDNCRPSTVLRDHASTLSRLKLTNSSTLGIQVLQEEEVLGHNQVVLNIQQRVADTSSYLPAWELVWQVSQGASVASLKQAIGERLLQPADQLMIAKHWPDKYEWQVIQSSTAQKGSKSQKGKKKGQNKINLRQAPYHIKDGDTIGVKNLLQDANHGDFSTAEDQAGKELLRRQAEEKKQQRWAARQAGGMDMGAAGDTDKGHGRPEVGLTIKVANFQ